MKEERGREKAEKEGRNGIGTKSMSVSPYGGSRGGSSRFGIDLDRKKTWGDLSRERERSDTGDPFCSG